MNLHEYQGKQLFAEFGLPVSKHEVVFNAEEAIQACNKIGGKKWVVKAQVHAGGRGKAGGVKLIESPEEISDTVLFSMISRHLESSTELSIPSSS